MPKHNVGVAANPGSTISIVTISFNQELYLRTAMESVLTQSGCQIEYVVVDPGSKDGSRDLIRSLADDRVKLYFEKDSGPADGLNRGFALTTGDILGFLNADDYFLPGALKKIADVFDRHPEVDIVAADGIIVDGDGRQVKYVKARQFNKAGLLYGWSSWLQQSVFFRRRAFEKINGFNVHNRTCWDGELFLDILSKGATPYVLSECLSAFRIHNSSITGAGSNVAAYEADKKRIFHNVTNRDFSFRDQLISGIGKIAMLVTEPSRWGHVIRKRFPK